MSALTAQPGATTGNGFVIGRGRTLWHGRRRAFSGTVGFGWARSALLAAAVLTLSGVSARAAGAAPNTAYVTNLNSNSVTPIDLVTNTPGAEIKVGKFPEEVAITPDGKTAYVTNIGSESVTPINVATDTPGAEIKVGKEPFGVAITPDGKTAYITNFGSESVTPINLAANTPGTEISTPAGLRSPRMARPPTSPTS